MRILTLKSNEVDWIDYNHHSHALKIRYRTGQESDYAQIPATLFQRLLHAESKVTFFEQHIRARYPNNSR